MDNNIHHFLILEVFLFFLLFVVVVSFALPNLSRFNNSLISFFGMAAMPFLCRGVWFLLNLSYHRNVSWAVYLPNYYFYICQKTNLHLYKRARLSSSLFVMIIKKSKRILLLSHLITISQLWLSLRRLTNKNKYLIYFFFRSCWSRFRHSWVDLTIYFSNFD